jgi:hypothetical protein
MLALGAGLLAAGALLGLLVSATAATAATCPNEALRAGPSARLPDCRAYELVTPEDTNGLTPTAINIGNSTAEVTSGGFDTMLASPSGESLIFETSSGSLPGVEGNGVFDQYRATRTAEGWQTSFVAPSGAQSFGPHPGGVSPDHGFSFWETSGFPFDRGSLQVDESNGDRYLRTPDGAYQPIGIGSLGADYEALGKWISTDGEHVIFTSRVKLEPDAPETGIEALYDRTPGGPTHVLSLLPGEITPTEDAIYQGGSADGTTQAFKLGGSLYLRRSGETRLIADEGIAPGPGAVLSCRGYPAEEGIDLEYRWLRDGAPIAAANSAEYTATGADSGHLLQCQLTARSAATGSTQTSLGVAIAPLASTPPPEPPYFGPPTPTPEGPTAGTTLTCEAGEEWGGAPSFAYQWYRDGSLIPGANSPTYEVKPADIPSNLQCAVTGTNAGGSATKFSPNLATSPAPEPEAPFAEAEVPLDLNVYYAGLSADGRELLYEQQGRILRYDTESGATTTIASGGEARIVLASADGSRVFFFSRRRLEGEGIAGQPNLYVSNGATVSFIATLSPADLVSFGGTESISLANWRKAVGPLQNIENGPASVPARATADGGVLVFQSHAPLAGYESEGHSEIYRYDLAQASLTCVSCPPPGTPPRAEAMLQSIARGTPTSALTHIGNLTENGEAVFFQTSDPLLPTDTDGVQDVYQWRDGALSLISSGESGAANHLYAMSPDGRDVFFITTDSLTPDDRNGNNQKIYDARVGGGFPAPAASPPCLGDECQGQPTPPPSLPAPASEALRGPPNPKPRHRRKHHPHRKHHHRRKGSHEHSREGAGGGKR